MTYTRRRGKATWTEVADADANYWKVRCLTCNAEWVKASKRNVELCIVGHHGSHHFGHPRDYAIVPMKREPAHA